MENTGSNNTFAKQGQDLADRTAVRASDTGSRRHICFGGIRPRTTILVRPAER
jgi:hypothetical protein